MYYRLLITFLIAFPLLSCAQQEGSSQEVKSMNSQNLLIHPGADQTHEYYSSLLGKRIAVVVNHTAIIGETHLVDSLVKRKIDIAKIFSPEHGFRGDADAGDHISDGIDPATGIEVVSLYGSKRKPSAEDLSNIDLVVFDIQDVGARFYTYISTLHYVMEACAELHKPLIILDRPNPNGHYVDGPMREDSFQSFVGMHRVPVVYGMTIGEYGSMINGEGWLAGGIQCDLTIVSCANYTHQSRYDLPRPPSPNLPNLRSVLLYPSLCFFEGTPLSVGRGTSTQFQVIGFPDESMGSYTFTPKSMFGAARPKLEGQQCHGMDLTARSVESLLTEGQINLTFLLHFYKQFEDKPSFFNANGWFDKLAGTTSLREMIQQDKSEQEIRASWADDLRAFDAIRTKYLLYP